MKSILLTALVIAAALSGCTDKGDDTPALTDEYCAALGLVLGTQEVLAEGVMATNGTDDNSTSDHELEHTTEPACVPVGPPASASIVGLPATLGAYYTATFTWVLNTPSSSEMHAMDTQVRVSRTANLLSNLTTPDTYGEKVTQYEHQNFFDGAVYESTFETANSGTYYFRAYAVVSGENIWSDEYVLEVTPVVETGVTTEITLSGGGFPGATADPESVTINLGDAVSWTSEDPAVTWSVESDSGPMDFTAQAGGASVLFDVPGSYEYTASATLDGVPQSLGDVTGSITVVLPDA